ncbi:hypothetical protein ECZU29_05340 [Escherichia coli]|nr:hypothetical protein ECZU17_30470 [Escherichia coli]GHL45684.1 hypothetical protein ECZU29_05340 [Escherichia coli]
MDKGDTMFKPAVKQGCFSPVMPVDDFPLAAVLHLVLETFKFGPDTRLAARVGFST